MTDLVVNGKSAYEIICGGSPCEKFAAGELAKFIVQSTGVALPVKPQGGDAPYISVGKTEVFEKSGLLPQWKKSVRDGIFIAQRGGNVFLAGKRGRSVLYAVYDFLETYLGVKFIASDETIVPQHEALALAVEDKTEEPSFDLRSFYTVQMENDPLLTARLRQVALYSEEKAEYGYGLEADGNLMPHNVFDYLDYGKYKDSHPEYFHCAMLDGNVPAYDLCWSQGIDKNGEIIRGGSADILSDNLIAFIKNSPGRVWYSLCQNDVPVGCECEKCRENKKLYGGHSGILLRYVNAVARKVERWRQQNCPEREIRLVTFAYAYTMRPPLDASGRPLVSAENNVWIWIANAEQNYLYACDEEGQNPGFYQLLRGWRKVAHRFCYWDYRINFAEYLFYFPWLNTMERDFRFFQSLGIDYLFCEATSGNRSDPYTWLGEIRGYAAGKLMWNTALSARECAREFCAGYYGKSADAVMRVIDLFEDNFRSLKKTNPKARIYVLLGYRTVEEDYYPRAMLESAVGILKAEMAECKDAKIAKRLQNVLLTPQRMLLRNYSAYYPGDEEGKRRLYNEFVSNCESAGIEVLGGWDFTLENLKKYPDYNWWKMNGIEY